MDKINQQFIDYLEKLLVKARNNKVHFDSMYAKQIYNSTSLNGITLQYTPRGYSLVNLSYYEEDDE